MPQLTLADCDFSKDVTKTKDGYLYSADCHKEVGRHVQVEEKRKEQVEKLEKALELKDLAIVTSHERIELWRDTSFKLEDRVNAIENLKEKNKWIYFGLGILVMGVAVHEAGNLK